MTTKSATTRAAGEAWSTLRQEMSLGDYVQEVLKDRGLNRGAHDYVYGAVLWKGGPDAADGGGDAHAAFSGLNGQTEAINRTVEYLKLAAWGDPIGRRALLLSGPPASGGEEIMARVVDAVESYSRSDGGRIYAIRDCPIGEDPLNLIEPGYRNQMVDVGSLQWAEGRLCPYCQSIYQDRLGSGDLMDIGVRRIVLGLEDGVGAALASGQLGEDCDLRLAVEQSNRGVLAYENLSDAPAQAVEYVLDLAARRSYPGKRGRTKWDGVVIATIDRAAFNGMCAEPSFARTRLRAHVVPTPYNLGTKLETSAYRSHRAGHDLLSRVHFSPLTIPTVAHLAVKTRTSPAASPEGMGGLSQGRVLSALEDCAALSGVNCVSPLLALTHLADYAEVHPEQVDEAAIHYAGQATKVLRKAATDGFEEQANDLLNSYRERLSWVYSPPDATSMAAGETEPELRAMEDAIGLKDQDGTEFRAEMSRYFEQNPEAPYTQEPRMRQAIESRLLHPLKSIRKTLQEVDEGSDDRDDWARRRGAVHDRLVKTYRFCDVCAVDLVAMLLTTDRPVRIAKKGRIEWDWQVRLDLEDAKEQLKKFRAALSSPSGQEGVSGC